MEDTIFRNNCGLVLTFDNMKRTSAVFPLWLLLVGRVSSELVNLCPPLETIHPCGCVSDGRSNRIDCIRVNSLEDTRRVLLGLKEEKDIFIDFLRSRFESPIPSNLFAGLRLRKLSFTNCELGGIGDEGRSSFVGLDNSLQELSVTFSFSEEHGLKFMNLSNLHALEELEIEGNYISTLSNDWFLDGPKNLRNVFVMNNLIQQLGDRAFASLTSVKNLWLTGNLFSNLTRSMFPQPANHLVSLDLTDNKISTLPEAIFSAMPSLKEVILDDNNIQHLPETDWSPVWQQLTRLYLKGNPLDCNVHIDWILTRKRPYVLKGTCVSPPHRDGQELKRLVDDSQLEEEM